MKCRTVKSKYFKAYLNEIPNEVTGVPETQVKCVFSKTPFTATEFIPLVMGVMEAYAQELLASNTPEAVYDNFNSAFGIFLSKLVPESYIYEHSKEHKEFKERVDATLGREEDVKNTEDNRFAAYLLSYDILTKECGMDPDSANLLLNKRLGTLAVANPERNEKADK